MEIPLFEEGETLRFERIILYPYPDLTKIWTRCWLTAVPDRQPNVEFRVLNPDGSENTSVFMLMRTEQRIETTLHLRNPEPGTTYQVRAELTEGLGDEQAFLEVQEFDMILEFRDPEAREAGFGVGVDWDEWRQAGDE